MGTGNEFWVREKTFGGGARDFWWRVDEAGNLAIRRPLSAREGRRRVAVHTLSREELERLGALMGDGAWHPLASGAHAVRSGSRPGGIAPFLHQALGWSAQATAAAGHVAVVLTKAGVWEWNGRRKDMEFRQVAPGVEKVASYFERRRRGAPRGPGPPRRRSERRGRAEPPRFDLAAKFRALSRALRARFEECDAGGKHHVEKGQRREGVVLEFLRGHLPPRYGVSRGEVVAATGEASRQMDALIYDAFRAPVLLESEGSRLLAAESIYAAIEVKPRLTVTELRGAVANLQSAKALSRAAVVGLGGPARQPNPPVFGVIFSFESVDRRLVAQQLRAHQEGLPPALWVDCVCVLDEAVLYRYSGAPGMWTPEAATSPTPLASVAAGHDSLLLFYLLLLQDLNAKMLRPPDLLHYAQSMGLPAPELL